MNVLSLLKAKLASKKGAVSIGEMPTLAWALIIFVIIVAIGLFIIQEFRDEAGAGTEAYTAINESLVGLGKFGDWTSLIVIVVVAAIIMGLVGFIGAARRT